MQWVRFRSDDGRIGFGSLQDADIHEYEGELFAISKPTGRKLALNEVKLLSPCSPSKIIGLWNNFHALAAKLGKQPPAHPLYFIKPSSSVIGPDEAIKRPASYAGKIVFEGELGVVIGKRCAHVDARAAASYIAGYTCVNDVTAIQILDESPDFAQWCRAKSFDTFGCLGPVISTDLAWAEQQVVTTLDGTERQNYALSDMIFPPAQIVSRLSEDMTLLPGDVIACGTSLGVGSMKDGATVEIRIAGIGTLRNVVAPP
jgi:2-keto-4-pentenoate hydratase/2-oxohepta-3-ene-1,7-dioic acid hydratase in catechol pathway